MSEVVTTPDGRQPVLAAIAYFGNLGWGTRFDILCYDGAEWRSYISKKTLEDKERVLRWRYATECLDSASEVNR